MRRATSAQAALRWADCSSVISSKVTTKPCAAAALHLGADPHQQVAALARVAGLWISPVTGAFGQCHAGGQHGADLRHLSASFWPVSLQVDAEQRAGGPVGQLHAAAPSRPITPAETPESTVSVKRRRSSIWL